MKLYKSEGFYFRSSIFAILSLTGAALNYALYPILVRILSTNEFGDFAAVVAISNQILGILIAFNIISIYLVKTQPEKLARKNAQTIQKMLIWLLLLLVVVLILISPYLHSLLKIEHLSLFLILAATLVVAVPGIIWTGYLQGHKEMIRIGTYNFSAALTKLIFASLLAVSLRSFGGVLGILLGAILGLVVLSLYPGVKLPKIRSVFSPSNKEEKKFIFSLRGYILMCLFAVGALSLLQNYDITLAKAMFSPSEAGVYSGISILSNALYFLSFLIIWIILPEIDPKKLKHNRRLISTSYKLLSLLTVAVISLELILRNYITKLLFGTSFSGQGFLLMFASLYQLCLVAITLYAYYLLVVRKKRAGILALIVTSSTLIIPAIYATTPLIMIKLLWLSSLGSFVLFWIIFRVYDSYHKPRVQTQTS
jgi:O-antigen/teichoic acid export membrane protein